MRYVTAKDLRVAMEHMRSVDLYGELVRESGGHLWPAVLVHCLPS